MTTKRPLILINGRAIRYRIGVLEQVEVEPARLRDTNQLLYPRHIPLRIRLLGYDNMWRSWQVPDGWTLTSYSPDIVTGRPLHRDRYTFERAWEETPEYDATAARLASERFNWWSDDPSDQAIIERIRKREPVLTIPRSRR